VTEAEKPPISGSTEERLAQFETAYMMARNAIDELWDGVPGLDDPTTLARLRNFLEMKPGSGYFNPVPHWKEAGLEVHEW